MMKKKKIIAGMVSVALLLSGCGGSTTEKVASLSKLGVDKSEIIISDKTDIKDTTYLLETTYSGADVPIERNITYRIRIFRIRLVRKAVMHRRTLIQQQLVPMSCSATIIRIYFQIRTHSQKR